MPSSFPAASLWRHRDFMKLWSAETVSQFGTQVSLLAIPLVAITILQATPFEVGLLGTIEFLPFVLFALPAGAWVDRLRRRPILITGDIGRAIGLASIPIAYELGSLTIWQLYVVAFVNGVLTVFFDVAYQSYLPSLVERDQIVDGNSKLEISRSAAQIAGPGVAGVIIGAVTAPLAILADAASFVGSALFVFGIRRHEPAPDRHLDEHGQPRGSMRAEIATGLRYVVGHPYLRSIAASTGWFNLFSNIGFAIYLLYVVRVLGLTPAVIGIVIALGNVGTLVGAFAARPIADRFGLGRTIIGSMAVSSLSLLCVAIAPVSAPVPLLVASGAFASLGIVYNINQVSFRQAITPPRMQGRMNATMRFIVWGTIPLGSILGGILGGAIGLHETIWIGAIGELFAFLPLLVGPLRSLRAMPAPVEEPVEEVGAPAGPPGAPEMAFGEALDETPEPLGRVPLVPADDG